MKGDLFIRTLLIIIVTLLALNLILSLSSNPVPTYAAGSIRYKVGCIGIGVTGLKTDNLEKLINEYSKEGWDPLNINIVAMERLGGMAYVVFKR